MACTALHRQSLVGDISTQHPAIPNSHTRVLCRERGWNLQGKLAGSESSVRKRRLGRIFPESGCFRPIPSISFLVSTSNKTYTRILCTTENYIESTPSTMTIRLAVAARSLHRISRSERLTLGSTRTSSCRGGFIFPPATTAVGVGHHFVATLDGRRSSGALPVHHGGSGAARQCQ